MVAPPFAVLDVRAVFIGVLIFGLTGIFLTAVFLAGAFFGGAFFVADFFAGAFLAGAFLPINLLIIRDFLAGFAAFFFALLATGFFEVFFVGTAPKAMASRLEKPLCHTMVGNRAQSNFCKGRIQLLIPEFSYLGGRVRKREIEKRIPQYLAAN